jgi:lipid A 3-O-deacylase
MKLTLTVALAAVVLLPASVAWAQPAGDPASIWTLQDENASIPGLKTRDHFYTNGLRLGWTSPTTAVPGGLADLGHTLWGEGQQRIGFDLSQQMYTPMDTQAAITNPRDRPYAGVLTGNFSLLSDTADTRSVLTLALGVVGPWAGAGDMQNGFHGIIGRPTVKDWHAQIPNTPIVELLHERTWRLPMGRVAGLETDVLPSLAVGLGDLRDYLQSGATIRIGQGLDSDFGAPRLRPGLSGGDAYTPTRAVAWYAFAGVDAQAVGYDLLLQAAPFRSGPHVTPLWDVAELQAGFAVMAAGMRLTVAYVAQTPEFRGQSGGIHQFVTAALSIRF